jgi:hypothetical protein
MCTECATPMAVSRVGTVPKLMSSDQPSSPINPTQVITLSCTTRAGATTPTSERKNAKKTTVITARVSRLRSVLSPPMIVL